MLRSLSVKKEGSVLYKREGERAKERESDTEGEGRERYTYSEHYGETLSRANLNTFLDRRLFQLNSQAFRKTEIGGKVLKRAIPHDGIS